MMTFTDLNLFQINCVENTNGRQLDLVFVNDPRFFEISRAAPLSLPEDTYHPTLCISMLYSCEPSTTNTSNNNSPTAFLF